MADDVLFASCPVCEQAPLARTGGEFQCDHCRLTVKPRAFLWRKSSDRYVVRDIGEAYRLARPGIVNRTFSRAALQRLGEHVYPDAALASIAAGEFDAIRPPSNTLAQILLEQLHETVFFQVNQLRGAPGPVIGAGASRFPQGTVPRSGLTWKDRGNLFLTNARLVFPSNTFTFIRMDRKLIAVRAFEDGLAVQRKGERFATYFVGCRAHQAALMAAYIQGKSPALQEAA